MTAESQRTIMCNDCATVECRKGYPKGIPSYCEANRFQEILEQTKTEYTAPGVIDIYLASGKVVENGYGKWPRIQEALEFSKELKVKKVGFASCVGLIEELRLITELFTGAGFEAISASCQVGRVSPEARGVTGFKDAHGLYCNPIAQAGILNDQKTELNFVLGLCMGHDILFNRFSKAPVSTLIVKDRVTGNNPAAPLYGSFQRQALMKLYCPKEKVKGSGSSTT